ncbi:MAG: hypothetical protein ACLSCV_08105 [Acutalibacteraceae bacterium]
MLALMADHRIVIQNGGIHEVLKTTEEEKELKRLTKIDASIQRKSAKVLEEEIH